MQSVQGAYLSSLYLYVFNFIRVNWYLHKVLVKKCSQPYKATAYIQIRAPARRFSLVLVLITINYSYQTLPSDRGELRQTTRAAHLCRGRALHAYTASGPAIVV